MSSGAIWVVGLVAAAATLLVFQHLRMRRIEKAWRAIASRREWAFHSGSGAFYNRDEFYLVAPSPSGGIQIAWSPGTRGSSPQTILRSRVRWPARLRIDPCDKLAGADARRNFSTGDDAYDSEFRVSGADSVALTRVLDAEWRSDHRANPIALHVSEQLLEATSDEIIVGEDELLAFLTLFSSFHTRLEAPANPAHG
jgi:hypothetical protein